MKMKIIHSNSTLEKDGWVLLSAEERAAAAPDMFSIPPRSVRDALQAGEAAKLLFDIETRAGGKVIDRGTERMWVIVKTKTADGYVGVLDNDPGAADNLSLHEGDLIVFGPEHVCDTSTPPRDYVVKKYGQSFFK
jgi:hypothetical protein